MNIINIADAVIKRAKNLQQFKVYSHIDTPIDFNGVVPFDLSIKDNIATFKVYALSKEEAKRQVDEWLKERT